jgi:hypothetical protein
MRIGRAIMAVALALAVAMLPASGGAASAANMNATHAHAAAATMADAGQAAPCDHDSGAVSDCGSIAVCALKSFTYAGLALPSLATPIAVASPLPVPVTEIADSGDGAPPFRPPRA